MNNAGNPEHLPKRGPGRPKGSQNKLGRAAKEVIAAAAEELGGMDRMVAWAKSDPANEKAFWTQIYPKIVPLTLQGDEDAPLVSKVSVELVRAKDSDA